MKPTPELKELWAASKERGLVLKSAVELLYNKGWGTWGTNTVKAAVDGNGGELREIVLRKVLLEYLERAESVQDGRAESAISQLASPAPPEYKTSDEWKTEAIKLREENTRLRTAIYVLTAPSTAVSSAAIERAMEVFQGLVKQSTPESGSGEYGQKSKHG